MNYYFLFFAWGICILVSPIGWGGAINRILFPKHRVDWGQRAAWGMAWSTCFGGFLNVTWTISQTAVLIYLALGFLYWLVDVYTTRQLLINIGPRGILISVDKCGFRNTYYSFVYRRTRQLSVFISLCFDSINCIDDNSFYSYRIAGTKQII